MEQKCKKCGREYSKYSPWNVKCYYCTKKEERNAMIIVGVVALAVVLGARLLWAKFVYHDFRCALAECRIMK